MRHLLRNWKTSLTGALLGLPILLEGIANRDRAKIVQGGAGILLGFFCADSKGESKN